MSNSQLIKLKSAIKNSTEVTLNLSSNLIVLMNMQVSITTKGFANGSLVNKIFWKT